MWTRNKLSGFGNFKFSGIGIFSLTLSRSCLFYLRLNYLDYISKVQPTRCNVFRSIYFYKLLYMFQAVPPPIIRSTKLYIQRQVLSNQYCCYRGWDGTSLSVQFEAYACSCTLKLTTCTVMSDRRKCHFVREVFICSLCLSQKATSTSIYSILRYACLTTTHWLLSQIWTESLDIM
jgi:hypothetical protein